MTKNTDNTKLPDRWSKIRAPSDSRYVPGTILLDPVSEFTRIVWEPGWPLGPERDDGFEIDAEGCVSLPNYMAWGYVASENFTVIETMPDTELFSLEVDAWRLEAAVAERGEIFKAQIAEYMKARSDEINLRADNVVRAQAAFNEAVIRSRAGGKNVAEEESALYKGRILQGEAAAYNFIPPITPLESGPFAKRWLDPSISCAGIAAQEWALKEARARVALRKFALDCNPKTVRAALTALNDVNANIDEHGLFNSKAILGVNLTIAEAA